MKKALALILALAMSTGILTACGKSDAEAEKSPEASTAESTAETSEESAEKTVANPFDGMDIRVVIGSTSTSGDSYLTAETTSRYLAKELNANIKVDAVGAAEALNAMQTVKPDGKTLMMFHDMTYLSVLFGAQPEDYALENMTVGPRMSQNPGACWAASKNAPYNDLKEMAEYLKASPDAVVRMACEAGGVSHIGFIVYYQWVVETYGQDVADRIVVVVGGSTGDKCQLLWDGNCDVIFADYTSLKDYTVTDDEKIAMKYMAVLDTIDGVDVPSYSDLGITMNGEQFNFSKDFVIYAPKDISPEMIKALDAAMDKVTSNPDYQADMEKMNYRAAYLPSNEAEFFIYAKRDSLAELIANAPSMDDLVQ